MNLWNCKNPCKIPHRLTINQLWKWTIRWQEASSLEVTWLEKMKIVMIQTRVKMTLISRREKEEVAARIFRRNWRYLKTMMMKEKEAIQTRMTTMMIHTIRRWIMMMMIWFHQERTPLQVEKRRKTAEVRQTKKRFRLIPPKTCQMRSRLWLNKTSKHLVPSTRMLRMAFH